MSLAEGVGALRVALAFEAAMGVDAAGGELYWPEENLPYGREAIEASLRVLLECSQGDASLAWRWVLLAHALGSYVPAEAAGRLAAAARVVREGGTLVAPVAAELRAALAAERALVAELTGAAGLDAPPAGIGAAGMLPSRQARPQHAAEPGAVRG